MPEANIKSLLSVVGAPPIPGANIGPFTTENIFYLIILVALWIMWLRKKIPTDSADISNAKSQTAFIASLQKEIETIRVEARAAMLMRNDDIRTMTKQAGTIEILQNENSKLSFQNARMFQVIKENCPGKMNEVFDKAEGMKIM